MRIQWPSRNTVTGRELGQEFGEVYKAIAKVRSLIASSSSVASPTSSGSVNIRRGSVAVVAGSNTITFSTPLSTTDYALSSLPVFVSSTETAQANLNAKSSIGFTCYSPSAGTLDYTAIEIA